MNLAWATDLHLDTVETPVVSRFCSQLNQLGVSALLVGGDIAESTTVVEWLRVLAVQLKIPIYFVLGNHDFYGGDIASVSDSVSGLQAENLWYLPSAGPVCISPRVTLVGHGGWGDCRIGDLEHFAVLTDYFAIHDLRQTIDEKIFTAGVFWRTDLIRKLNDLGEEAAEVLRPQLIEAAMNSDTVLVLTHVPPFREACWHEGSISDDKFLPGFTCIALGDLLKSVAAEFSETRFEVLCGHTHGSGSARILPNLNAYTGFGDYGELYSAVLKIDGTQLSVPKPAI
jgi:Icc-related predicted phosphoesterase